MLKYNPLDFFMECDKVRTIFHHCQFLEKKVKITPIFYSGRFVYF